MAGVELKDEIGTWRGLFMTLLEGEILELWREAWERRYAAI
jgi:hypothetical protein